MLVLGIETSCDETAAAVVEDGRRVRSDVVASQVLVHAEYGGVVPEVASRQHLATVVPVLRRAVRDAGIALDALDGIAVTRGPGLVGALLAAAFLEHPDAPPPPGYPHVALLVSGGHTGGERGGTAMIRVADSTAGPAARTLAVSARARHDARALGGP